MSRKYQLGAPGFYLDFSFSRLSNAARKELHRSRNVYFEGQYQTWSDAVAASTGYDAPAILQRAIEATRKVVSGEVAFERDTVTFDKPEIPHTVLCWLLYTAMSENGRICVLDFGGALGSIYNQIRHFIPEQGQLTWCVIEQEGFVRVGREEFETDTLRFYASAGECLTEQQPNMLLLSGSLQYLERPYELLSHLLSLGVRYCLIDKTMARAGQHDILSVQHVPQNIYPASYPVWMLDSDRMEETFAAARYDVLDRFEANPGSTFGYDEQRHPYAGWFLAKHEA